jgi:hypothetical protein
MQRYVVRQRRFAHRGPRSQHGQTAATQAAAAGIQIIEACSNAMH